MRSGNSTAALLAAACSVGGHLWSVDIDQPQVPREWHDDPSWHLLRADDLSQQAKDWLPAACDVLFIDTSHTYGHTLAELREYVPRVAPGGTVLLHDTQFLATGGGNGDDAGEPAGEVAAALDAYCGETGRKWENRPGSYGLGVIRQ